jgi:serine/threonine protein kinase
VQLSDFGVSRYAPKGAHTFTGTPMYMAPEVVMGKEYTFTSDIWSLGHVLYELCTLELLFSASSVQSLQNKVRRALSLPRA